MCVYLLKNKPNMFKGKLLSVHTGTYRRNGCWENFSGPQTPGLALQYTASLHASVRQGNSGGSSLALACDQDQHQWQKHDYK